jgi:hypothetical protein
MNRLAAHLAAIAHLAPSAREGRDDKTPANAEVSAGGPPGIRTPNLLIKSQVYSSSAYVRDLCAPRPSDRSTTKASDYTEQYSLPVGLSPGYCNISLG